MKWTYSRVFLLCVLSLAVLFPFTFYGGLNKALANETITFGTTYDQDYNIYGNGLSTGRWGQSFTVAGNEDSGTGHIQLYMTGVSLDNVTVSLYDNSGGHPNTLIQTASLPLSTLTGSCATYDFTFTSGLGLSSGQTYWIVVDKDGTPDASNHPLGCATTLDPLAGENFKYQDGGGVWNLVGYSPIGSIDLVGSGSSGGGTTTTATSTGMTGSEQLLGLCVIIYFISFLGWRAIFSPFNHIV